MCKHTTLHLEKAVRQVCSGSYSDCSQVCESNVKCTAWLLKAPSIAVEKYIQGRDVFVGWPKSSGKYYPPDEPVVDGHTALACSRKIAYRKLVLAVSLLTSIYITTFMRWCRCSQTFPHRIRLVHETTPWICRRAEAYVIN